ncbi:similar to Saccharomyces cerevisiae YGL142C GPI10 Integral membrane protein involved in glycosylphosphatidylinositol (GPI) anchor synthesis [Maudiozyma barnettii]|uniref:Mannosyltransferase n=1 Tax=Maudiozyma barnettii TaxID=61262 RepID=A0A8H2VFC9_9SACH|nr:putative glycosylphosphatidylinositol-alpha 1,2 mannosyltransferase [Kazachstania barnettii]CAB4254506.1 similar to Saccharomyces cerevisiae YGL142C GPI10 Integral membrane protein involved in glycosylphosphatidylinositol (GPI) anchor synthesis [Kazachstania barnettii]CAD1782523.1 similar to Saccharomyces cerevisiae YGL142C GPI10 Integral membrane protein involved in glycosylphosphatidylinositol (GPI) anchor synthesis [Kazachstania barnettii]
MSVLDILRKPNFVVLLIWRLINALAVNTFFQADEFWQSLEPAHVKAFGYGELTWEWKLGIRGYAFPFLFELCYRLVKGITWILKLWNVDPQIQEIIEYNSTMLLPKILMAILGAVGEYHMVILVRKLFVMSMENHKDEDKGMEENNSSDYHCTLGQATLIANVISMTNFFNWFVMTRTFVNSFETILTSIALCHWDWTGGAFIHTSEFSLALFWGIMASFVRVSNTLIWLILGGFLMLSIIKKREYSKLFYLFKKIVVVFAGVLFLNVVIDFYFYGKLIFPIFRFLKFNFTSPLSKFYGTAPWNFYLFQGIPIMTGAALIPLIYGMRHSLSSRKASPIMYAPFVQMKFVVLLNVIVYSTLAHKEFRFIYPLQPFMLVIATFGYQRIRIVLANYMKLVNYISGLIVIFTMFGAFIISNYHESGVISVVKYLHEIPNVDSVGFIMPCHSTPWQSYLHRNDIKDLWAITCSPPIHLLDDPQADEKLKSYMDESDYLYKDIPKFIKDHMVSQKPTKDMMHTDDVHQWPEYVVIFQHLDENFMHEYLKNSSYREVKRYFNSISHWDNRRNGDVIVYHKKFQ